MEREKYCPDEENSDEIKEDEKLETTKEQENQENQAVLENENNKITEEKIVNNAELGISYREPVVELPKYRKGQYGIKRIIRRELISPLPEGIRMPYREPGQDPHLWESWQRNLSGTTKQKMEVPEYVYSTEIKFKDIYRFITNGRFPSYGILKHKMMMQYASEKFDYSEEYSKNGGNFQKIKEGYFIDPDQQKRVLNREKFEKFWLGRGDLSWLNMRNRQGSYKSAIMSPLFCFGHKNKNFKKYIDSIYSDNEIYQELLNNGYSDKPLNLISPSANSYSEAFSQIQKIGHKKDIYTEIEAKNFGIMVEDTGQHSSKDDAKNLAIFKTFSQEQKEIILTGNEFVLPIINQPGITPLRFCHAEFAIIPTKKSLN